MWFKIYVVKKTNKFVKLLNELSINLFLQYFGAGEIRLVFIGSGAQLRTRKRNLVCWQKKTAHVFLHLVTILRRIVCLFIHNKRWAFSSIFRTGLKVKNSFLNRGFSVLICLILPT